MQSRNTWQDLLNPGGAKHYFVTKTLKPFQVNAPNFSAVNAWWLSELCRLIYRRGPGESGFRPDLLTRADILDTVNLQEQRFFDTGNVQCAIITSKVEISSPFAALVFRGTTGKFGNWIHNFDAFPAKWPRGGWVHKGFKKVFDGIWDELKTTLLAIDVPMFYTGHSLGAAMATLAASMLPPRALYTFGSPRVGNAAFLRSLDRIPIYRMITSRDIVSSTPPSLASFKFLHAGEAHDLNPGKDRDMVTEDLIAPTYGFTEENTSSLFNRFQKWFPNPPRFLADHAPLNYTSCLKDPI